VAGFDVVIDELRKAGKAAISAGEQAGTVDLGSAVSGVAGALTGSRSAKVVVKTAAAWRTQIKNWSSEAGSHGRLLHTAADYYATNEQAAEQDLSNASRGR
jgi:hypothetical protein